VGRGENDGGVVEFGEQPAASAPASLGEVLGADAVAETCRFGPSQEGGRPAKSIRGIAAVACLACCVGPTLWVLGAVAALGLVSMIFIGIAGLFTAVAAAVVAFIVVRRRTNASCSVRPEPVPIELTRRRP
jgi:hypothetical protein